MKPIVALLVAFVALVFFPVMVFAQPDTPVQIPATTWYASVTGVVALTGVIVAALKRLIGNVAYLNTLPTWIYAIIVSAILTALCTRVWHTMPGELWQNIMQAVLMAAASSGFYEWIRADNLTKSMAMSALSAGVNVMPKNLPTRDLR